MPTQPFLLGDPHRLAIQYAAGMAPPRDPQRDAVASQQGWNNPPERGMQGFLTSVSPGLGQIYHKLAGAVQDFNRTDPGIMPTPMEIPEATEEIIRMAQLASKGAKALEAPPELPKAPQELPKAPQEMFRPLGRDTPGTLEFIHNPAYQLRSVKPGFYQMYHDGELMVPWSMPLPDASQEVVWHHNEMYPHIGVPYKSVLGDYRNPDMSLFMPPSPPFTAERAKTIYDEAVAAGVPPRDALNQLQKLAGGLTPDPREALLDTPAGRAARQGRRPIESWLQDPKRTAPIPNTDLQARINARNSWYHTTTPQGFRGILESGEIRPGVGDRFKGVSVSRVPAIEPKTLPINLVLDPEYTPPAQPTTDFGYEKTVRRFLPTPFNPNPAFEYETRTLGKPVPKSAIRGVIINKEAWSSRGYQEINGNIEDAIRLAKEHGLPVKLVDSTAELKRYRATFGKAPSRAALYSMPPLGATAGLKYIQSQSTPTPSQGGPHQLNEGTY